MTADVESKDHVDLSDEQVHWDLGESLSYGDYLHLNQLLSAQQPVSSHHDEMLFHRHPPGDRAVAEAVHPRAQRRDRDIMRDDLGPAFKMLARVSRVQTQLTQILGRALHDDTVGLLGVSQPARQEPRASSPTSTACSNS